MEWPSINSFKTYVNRNTLPANPLFFYGDRKSQIVHTRLRLKCRNLNHLFLKYIVVTDSPNCVCGESEKNHHYLFQCPLYNHIRLTLFDKLRQIPSCVCLQITFWWRLPIFLKWFEYSLKIQLHFLTDYYYLCLTAWTCIYFTSVEIQFPSVVYVMFNYCHVIVYV